MEGDLETLYWTLSYWELSQKIQLKYGELAAVQLCQFSGLAEIARQIFGGSKDSKPKPDYEVLPTTGNIEQDVANIKRLLTFG